MNRYDYIINMLRELRQMMEQDRFLVYLLEMALEHCERQMSGERKKSLETIKKASAL